MQGEVLTMVGRALIVPVAWMCRTCSLPHVVCYFDKVANV